MVETVLVTGASGGIGEALATLFAKDRARLLLVARSGGRLEALAAQYRDMFGVEVHTFPCDLSDAGEVENLCAQIAKKGIEVDVLINNAGYGLNGEAVRLEREAQLGIIDLNCRALADLSLRYLPSMLARGRGGIIQLASVAGLTPGPYMATYYASKAFVVSFSQALAKEAEGRGVTITAVLPGFTETGFAARANMGGQVIKRVRGMSADEVAEAAYSGFRKGRRMVITGWQNRFLAAMARFAPTDVKLAAVKWLHDKRGD